MNFDYPLILVAKKEYLEAFQRGVLYMVNCLHYQQMKNDESRGDEFDGAIKCSYNNYEVDPDLLKEVKNGKFMGLTSYIKCFFHFKDSDVEKISDNKYRFSISEISAIELQSFHEEYALLVYDLPKFIKRFSDACENKKNISNYYYSDVFYIEDSVYPKYEQDLIDGLMEQRKDGMFNPIFVKHIKYSPQQEFRIAVSFSMGNLPENTTGIRISDSIDFQMADIKDISVIVKLSDIIEKPIYGIIRNSDSEKGAKIEYYL